MRAYSNIEPSAFRKGEYVGYREGQVWRIRRNMRGKLWGANVAEGGTHFIFAATLDEMSQKLREGPTTTHY
jgi:hypothetical protein